MELLAKVLPKSRAIHPSMQSTATLNGAYDNSGDAYLHSRAPTVLLQASASRIGEKLFLMRLLGRTFDFPIRIGENGLFSANEIQRRLFLPNSYRNVLDLLLGQRFHWLKINLSRCPEASSGMSWGPVQVTFNDPRTLYSQQRQTDEREHEYQALMIWRCKSLSPGHMYY